MNRLIIAALLAVLASPLPAYPKEPAPQVDTRQLAPNEADLQEHGRYTNKRGATVHSPAHTKSGAVPNGASAQCRDGTYSFSQSQRGTCSHHGGVAQWLQ